MGLFDWLSERRSGASAASKALIRAVGASYEQKLTPTSASVGRGNPYGLRVIDAYPIADPVPHWLYVTDGLSDDRPAGAEGSQSAGTQGTDRADSTVVDLDTDHTRSGAPAAAADSPTGADSSPRFGIEFTMRVLDDRALLPSRTPPEWPMKKLLQLILEEVDQPDDLTDGSTVMFPTSALLPDQPAELTNVLVLTDPVLGLQDVEQIGPVQFLQVVLISDDDYREARESGLGVVVDRLRSASPLAPIIAA